MSCLLPRRTPGRGARALGTLGKGCFRGGRDGRGGRRGCGRREDGRRGAEKKNLKAKALKEPPRGVFRAGAPRVTLQYLGVMFVQDITIRSSPHYKP